MPQATRMSCSSFNPKREARPSQTVSARTGRCNRWSFNPKREARPSQTKIISLEALLKQVVSIPNGKPGPLRREQAHMSEFVYIEVSIPNGKPGPLRRGMAAGREVRGESFQSQTGSQALSDQLRPARPVSSYRRFNPKREARPSQTMRDIVTRDVGSFVSIPNGKPGPLRQRAGGNLYILHIDVSIPNGKPGPLRPSRRSPSRPTR